MLSYVIFKVCVKFDQMLKDENETLDKIHDNLVVLAQQLLENVIVLCSF